MQWFRRSVTLAGIIMYLGMGVRAPKVQAGYLYPDPICETSESWPQRSGALVVSHHRVVCEAPANHLRVRGDLAGPGGMGNNSNECVNCSVTETTVYAWYAPGDWTATTNSATSFSEYFTERTSYIP
jgi:hypothetical protein